MKCLDNFIGVRQFCNNGNAIVPRSGLHIEDLEGINVKNISEITAEIPNAVDFINQKIQFAGKKVLDDAMSIIAPDLVDSLIVERALGGCFSDKYDTAAGDYNPFFAGNSGLRIRKVRTAFTNLRIPNIYLLADTDIASVVISIVDGAVIKTITVDNIVAKVEKQVFIDYVSTTEQVDIYWDTTAIATSTGTTYSTQKTSHCGCANGTYDFITAQGYKAGVATNEIYGIRADIQVECNTDKMMCLLVDKLRMCILYKAGIELLKEWLATDRLNFLAIHGKEWAEKKIEEWNETEYKPRMETMKPSFKNFLMSFDEFCFNCGGYRYGYVHP